MLILIAGLPGSGKTTLARAIAKKYGASHFNSDQLRREMGLWGSYRPEDKARVYEELLRRSRQALSEGKPVVVDSTFYKASLRKTFEELAAACGQKPMWVFATAPDTVLRKRVSKPRPDSEADESVLEKIKAAYEPLEMPHLTIYTSKSSVAATVRQVFTPFYEMAKSKAMVEGILQRQAFPGGGQPAPLVETHISWVILTPEFAFKIKRPVRFEFLDFSTLSLRHKYCQEEVRLNRRLAPGTYLGVLPIGEKDGQIQIAEGIQNPVDYAVWMRREDDQRQLDRLIKVGQVQPDNLQPLAHQLAAFHRKHALAHPDFDPKELLADFGDLFHHEKTLAKILDTEALVTLAKIKTELPVFIEKHAARLQARAASGLWVDGHGDLHCRNIFLTEPPIIFDCIEFAPHLRRLDVLNELAFLCMDLDHHARPDLADAVFRFYQQEHPCITLPADEQLLLFFKAYRANVRLKVALLAEQPNEMEVRAYWELMIEYWKALQV